MNNPPIPIPLGIKINPEQRIALNRPKLNPHLLSLFPTSLNLTLEQGFQITSTLGIGIEDVDGREVRFTLRAVIPEKHEKGSYAVEQPAGAVVHELVLGPEVCVEVVALAWEVAY